MPEIPVLWRLQQENSESEAFLGYKEKKKVLIQVPLPKQNKTKPQKQYLYCSILLL